MRRRERWTNLAWVSWVLEDRAGGTVAPMEAPPQNVGESLRVLTQDYGRYVEMEHQNDVYQVRVLPQRQYDTILALNVGFHYKGPNLRNILATAVVELDLLANGHLVHSQSAVEMQRWVP